jgi:T-complex protein 1 subunit theta
VAKFLRPVISSKQFGYESFLADLVAEACIAVREESNFNVDNVRTVKVIGGGVVESTIVKVKIFIVLLLLLLLLLFLFFFFFFF